MSVLVSIVSYVFFLGIVFFPPILLYFLEKRYKRNRFILYIVIGVVIGIGMITLFSWWTTISNKILLTNYGYNFEALSEIKRYSDIKPQNKERVKELEIALSGIGWQIKAILGSVFYLLYLIVVYIVKHLIKKWRGH